MAPLCPKCGQPARLDRIHYKDVWACRPCLTWVGCHEGTTKPLGVPADEETRGLRRLVHGAFDHIWREGVRAGESKAAARTHAYIWLAANLGLPPERCHVAMFDAGTCRRALAFLRRGGVFYSWEDTQ